MGKNEQDKQEESNVYKELADLIDDMSPEIIQETIKKTPKQVQETHMCG